jgi:hydrogenase maturation protease
VRTYRREELLARPLTPRVNPHAPGLQETLLTLELVDRAPGEVLLVGVVPEAVEVGVGLSPAVEAALPVVLERVVTELGRLGATPRRRREPGTADLWWRRPAGG